MIDPELAAKLGKIEAKADAAYRAAEATRKYLFWMSVITLALIVVPLIGLVFAIPRFIDTYTSTFSSLLNGTP